MNFLFRVPLFDFNPKDEGEICHNWEKIRKAIQLSSQSLFKEIEKKNYTDLSPRIKLKILKYLLRGRYRPTPFGHFAGVGEGVFSDNCSNRVDINSTHNIPSTLLKTDKVNSSNFFLNDSIHQSINKVYFLKYCEKDNRWNQISFYQNELINHLLKKVSPGNSIRLDEFQNWFKEYPDSYISFIWKRLIEIGILVPIQSHLISQSSFPPTDLVLDHEISLPESIQHELESLKKEAGNLFLKSHNAYIKSFVNWFFTQFDDRRVPILTLLKSHEFVNSTFLLVQSMEKEEEPFIGEIWNNTYLDLKKHVPLRSLDHGIFDLQVIFKTIKNNHLIIENFVCNRPFVYYGRFNRDSLIRNNQKEKAKRIYTQKEDIYASLEFKETVGIQNICNTYNIFPYNISPFSSTDKNSISLSDIYIGIEEDSLILIHRKLHQRIIPVILHPLNGKEISHPIMRLLWEIANQDSYKFFSYTHDGFLKSNYSPQLNWGKLILQTRRWFIDSNDFKDKYVLFQWLIFKEIPDTILAGYLDRELMICWKNENELQLLWNELKKIGRLSLSDPVWHDESPFYSLNNQQVYPQFVYSISKKKSEFKLQQPINYADKNDSKCLYLVLFAPNNEADDYLIFLINSLRKVFLDQRNYYWYFLFYPGHDVTQIRIRFLNINLDLKEQLAKDISWILANENLKFEFRQYYPEYQKYSEQGYQVSERLFHLESAFLISPNKDRLYPLFLDKTEKIKLIQVVWIECFLALKNLQKALTIFKSLIKAIDPHDLKRIKWEFDDSKRSLDLNFPIGKYVETILKHPLLLFQIEEYHEELILNHIHMMVNRFFPDKDRSTELLVYYSIYKGLGKSIYGEK